MDYKTEVTVEVEPRDFGQALRHSDDQAEVINGMALHIWELSPYRSDLQIISMAGHLTEAGKELVKRLAEEVSSE